MRIFLLVLIIFFTIQTHASEKNQTKPVVLKWMLGHAPNNYFIEMARYFKKRVEIETKKKVIIDIIDDFDNEKKFRAVDPETSKLKLTFKTRRNIIDDLTKNPFTNLSNDEWKDLMQNNSFGEVFYSRVYTYKLMLENKIDMGQAYTHFLARVADTNYHALELPYVFDNYDHIERFFSSKTGTNLLIKSTEKTGLRGLAYTFSGGLLQTLSREKNNLTLDFSWKNKKFRNSGSFVRDMYLNHLGVDLINLARSNQLVFGNNNISIKRGFEIVRPTQLINTNVIDGEEITLPDIELQLANTLELAENKGKQNKINRIKKLSVSETSHTLLSTVFLINEKSFQKLNSEQQKIVQQVAIDAAKMERELTINRYNKAKKFLLDKKFTWYTMSEKERLAHKENAKPVYENLYKKFPTTREIVEGIEKTRVINQKVAEY